MSPEKLALDAVMEKWRQVAVKRLEEASQQSTEAGRCTVEHSAVLLLTCLQDIRQAMFDARSA